MNSTALAKWIEDFPRSINYRFTDEEWRIILRALRLLAAAEANDGSTPECDAAQVQVELWANGERREKCTTAIDATTASRLERERNGLAARVEELARLRARLEIDFATDGNGKRVPFPTGGPDGIACRDETIRILESALAEAERKCARLRFHAEAMARGLDDWSIYSGCPSNVAKAYRAEFKEE